MSTITIRLPDDKHLRLKQFAKSRHLSVTELPPAQAGGLAQAGCRRLKSPTPHRPERARVKTAESTSPAKAGGFYPSVDNKLVEELTTSILSAHDAEVRFRALALKGNPKKALALLDKLDNDQK